MSTPDNKYTMNISLNVLNHLGINLYSNTPAVLAEVIANSWDAGATEVKITYDKVERSMTILDNGCGMTIEDINKRYLYIGYKKRDEQEEIKGRKHMGRKGIGKLSLFSIADKILVQSAKATQQCAFIMDANKIKEHIEKDSPETIASYHPEEIKYDFDLLPYEVGTAIKITELKKNITEATISGLKKRIARRFSIIKNNDFAVTFNDEQIDYTDRGYFYKARFLFQYGNEDYSKFCEKLDVDDDGRKIVIPRNSKFNENGDEDKNGEYQVSGWIAIAHESNQLDGSGEEDNLNNIVVVVRGKVAQEDILHQSRIGALVTKYIFGEIQADFLDDGEDISTSSRQKFIEDAPPYKALKKFVEKEIGKIRYKTSQLKEKRGTKKALASNHLIKKWYDQLDTELKKKASALFGKIEQIEIEEKHRATLYASGILAFEKIKIQHSLDELVKTDVNHIEGLLKAFKSTDEIEAVLYYQIAKDRVAVIDKLKSMTDENAKERSVQEFIYERLWLLDPAWERATSDLQIEKTIYDTIFSLIDNDEEKEKTMRVDIKYRNVVGSHVIIELKRASRKITKIKLQEQIERYMRAVENQLQEMKVPADIVEGICIIGKLPSDWVNNREVERRDRESLRVLNIRVLTYSELINNAYSAYKKFLDKRAEVGELLELFEELNAMGKIITKKIT